MSRHEAQGSMMFTNEVILFICGARTFSLKLRGGEVERVDMAAALSMIGLVVYSSCTSGWAWCVPWLVARVFRRSRDAAAAGQDSGGGPAFCEYFFRRWFGEASYVAEARPQPLLPLCCCCLLFRD